MKVLIVEDEPLAVERLKLILDEYDKNIEVAGTVDSVSSAKEWFATHPLPDLAFMDIQLADGSSFSIFSETSVKCPLIFTTAYDRYALDAFRLFSIDYLLKPITLADLAGAMNKFRDMVSYRRPELDMKALSELLKEAGKSYKERFLVKLGTRMFFVGYMDVCYFYAVDKTVFLVDKEGYRYVIDHTLEQLQEMLNPGHFFRLNRKVIASINAIKEIKTYINRRLRISLQAGKNREDVIIARHRVQAFKEWTGQ